MDVRTAFFVFMLAVFGYIAALMVLPLFPYVMAAGLLAFILFPTQKRLERRLESTPISGRLQSKIVAFGLTAFALVAAVVPLAVFSIVVLQTVVAYLRSFDGPEAVEELQAFAREIGLDDDTVASIEEQILSEIETEVLTDVIDIVVGESLRLLNLGIEMGIGLLVLVFLLYYLLVDGDTFVAWLGEIAPLEPTIRDELFDEVNNVTWAVIKSHVLVAVVEGILGGFGLWLVGISNVAFWTMVMIIVSFLPAIGVWFVWGPAVGYLAAIGEPTLALVLLLYGLAVLSVVDNYLRAIFVDRSSGLHPAVVLIGVIGGIYLLGIMGLFLGPVLLAVFKAGLNVFGEAYGNLEPRAQLADTDVAQGGGSGGRRNNRINGPPPSQDTGNDDSE
ncbi:AI-2E family transporter [Halobacteria archaeon AArc-curdl1]|uniref:AI-2E family transporter n=1 Tax=Natronosalvus hydrolyticus TaxID=2979988 RepID=A0AAP3E4R5_9EURY|nr:AI-2E family transporter [Halobacteria archaeon AArc-curdl1]